MVQQEYVNQEELRRAVKAIVEPGHVFEVRILANNKKNPASGYFTDADTLLRALEKFDLNKRSVYLTLNELSDDLYDREQRDRLLINMTTTSDSDVTAYRWLFIDLDPNRAAGVSSTDEELESAKSLAGEVRNYLSGLGFSKPVYALSGNGCHLLYRIDLPNTLKNRDLVKKCLEVLASIFNNEAVKIDTVNYNPSRICKLHGTLAQKGANTKKRPHRFSRIVEDDGVTVNSKDVLMNLAGMIPEEPKQEASPSGPFDIVSWMDQHGLRYKEQQGNGYRKFVLEECPFDSSHKSPDSMITLATSGAIGFRCLHNSCQGRSWKDVRTLFEPDAYTKKAISDEDDARISAGYEQHKAAMAEQSVKAAPKKQPRKLKSAADLMKRDIPDPIVYIGTDSELPLLVEGTCILSAKPKMGKSWLALAICFAVTKGEPILGYNTRKCGALYLDLETSENIQQKRIKKMIEAMGEVPENLYLETETDSLENGFCDQIEAYMQQDPNIGVVIVDVFQVIRSSSKSSKETEYDHAYRDLTPLNRLALKYHIAIILVTHDKKQQDPDDPFANILGSTGLQGAATQMMVLFKKNEQIHLSVKGKTIDGVPEFCVKFADGVWSQTAENPDAAKIEARRAEYLSSDIRKAAITIAEKENWYGNASSFIAKSAAVGIGLEEDAKAVGGFLTRNIGLFEKLDGVLIEKSTNGNAGNRYRISKYLVDFNDDFEKNITYFENYH